MHTHTTVHKHPYLHTYTCIYILIEDGAEWAEINTTSTTLSKKILKMCIELRFLKQLNKKYLCAISIVSMNYRQLRVSGVSTAMFYDPTEHAFTTSFKDIE